MNKFLTKLEGKYAAIPNADSKYLRIEIYNVIDEAINKLQDLGIANLSPKDKATIRFYYEDQINYIIKDGKHGKYLRR